MSAQWTAAREAEIRARIEAASHGTCHITGDHSTVKFALGAFTDLPDALAEIGRLRKVIEEAPHMEGCPAGEWDDHDFEDHDECVCWKREALGGGA